MNTFTIITGVVSLIGFAIQLTSLPSKYRRICLPITLVIFGICIGAGFTSFTGLSVHLPQTITLRNVIGVTLFAGTALLIFLCFGAAMVYRDAGRRTESSKIGSAVSGFFIFLLVFFSSFFFPAQRDDRDGPELTYDERIEFAVDAARKNNFERALTFLESASNTLLTSDPRRETLIQLIEQTKSQQKAFYTVALSPQKSSSE